MNLLRSLLIKSILSGLLFSTIFFPLVSNQPERYDLQVDGAQSVSALLIVWGTKSECAEIKALMIGVPYQEDATLHLWTEIPATCASSAPSPYYLTTGFFWADILCTKTMCMTVPTP